MTAQKIGETTVAGGTIKIDAKKPNCSYDHWCTYCGRWAMVSLIAGKDTGIVLEITAAVEAAAAATTIMKLIANLHRYTSRKANEILKTIIIAITVRIESMDN